MQKIEAGSLYDALFKFESRFQKRSAYPIHKKLKFPKGGSEDIYDWLLARLSIADDARILDAGSGVGYGAVRIAQHSKNVQIVGLSISECEVAESNRVAEIFGLTERLQFSHENFDQDSEGGFDVVLAVESLKHSKDLSVSIKSLVSRLSPDGHLVVVEDLYAGPDSLSSALEVVNCWGLERLFRKEDFLTEFEQGKVDIFDLTEYMVLRSRLLLELRIIFLRAIRRLVPSCQLATAISAYLGGTHLEVLYARRQMTYQAIVYSPD